MLQIIDEWHREYFPPVQNFDSEDDNAENSYISSASEDEESNETLLEKKLQHLISNDNQNNTFSMNVVNENLDNFDLNITEKMDNSCSCRMECMSKFSFHEIHDHICSMRELSKEERDMYIMGKIKSRSTGSVSSRHDAKRQRYEYSFDDREVCKDAFLFLHDIGEKYLKNLVKHMKTNGIRPRTHGNSGKKPNNALSFEEIKFVVQFIKRYSEDNGLPMPAAPRGRDTEPPTFLPCSTSKRDIHDMKLVRKSLSVRLSYPLSIPFGLRVYLTFKLPRPDLMYATHVSAIGNTF